MFEFFLSCLFARIKGAFFEVEFAHSELVFFCREFGFGLFALAALFFAVFGALIACDGFLFFLGLTFFVLFFAQLAAYLRSCFALLSGVAGVGAFHDGVEAGYLGVGFYPGLLGESGQG